LTVISSTEDVSTSGSADVCDTSISVESRGHTTLLTITGQVDASSSGFMDTVVRGFTARSGSIVVDVSGSELYGARPLRVLADCDRRSRRAGAGFVTVTSPLQQTLLRRIDRSGTLRTVTSVAAAVQLSHQDDPPRDNAPVQLVDPHKLRC